MNLQSKLLKLFVATVLVLAGIMAYAASTGQLISAPQNLLGIISSPFQKAASAVGSAIDSLLDDTVNAGNLKRENEELKEQLARLRLKIADYDRMASENREYQKLFAANPNRRTKDMLPATVIGRDGMDRFYSFTVDVGDSRGVKKNDVVVCSDGLVGVVTETGRDFARVSTILSPNVNVGCFIGSSRETGIVSGNYDLSGEGCIAGYLSKETSVVRDDIVTTSGYGTVFPRDLVVGTVVSTGLDNTGNSAYALVKPAADIKNVKFVFILIDSD